MTVSFMKETLVPNEYQDYDTIDMLLAEEVSQFFYDPLGWVEWAFDWGHGELEGFDGPDKWQRDELEEWGRQIRKNGFNGVDPVDPIRFSTASGHGIGKGHPVDMPFGKGFWGDLKVGSLVYSDQGQLTPVTAVNHYRREHFKVTFDDGSSTIVSGQHEWHVRGRQERRNNVSGWRTMETQEILQAGVKRPNGKSLARQWEIPIQSPVQYGPCEVPVDAYTYGVWLGDGDKRSGRITNVDNEVWGNVDYTWNQNIKGMTKTLYGLGADLRKHGLFGCTTYTAKVDRRYIESNERLAVLQGLMDTDGWVEKCGSAAFCSASAQLVHDVVEIARSLGLKAREPKFKKNECAGAWATHITWDGVTTLFRIKRKQDSLIAAEHRYQCRWIDSIESVGLKDGMCIEVEGGLYQTNDHIVTHNSAKSSWVILFIMSTRPYAKGIVTANTGEQLRTKTWAELGKWKKRCIVGHWFEYNNGKGSMSLYHKSFPESWRCDAQTCREENSEAFAGLHSANSTPFYLFDEACHDDQTEVMTDGGWKYFKDITSEDKLLTMDANTRRAYYDNPVHIHTSDYNGELMVADVRGCSFAVTPNHRMLFQSRKLPHLQFQEAGQMRWNNKKMMRHIQWDGDYQQHFTIPEYQSRRVNYPAHTVQMDDWLELLGWFITEGHVTSQSWVNKDGTINSEVTQVVITQKQKHYTDEIEQCVRRMRMPYTRRKTGIWINSVALAHHLNSHIGKGFAGKRVPDYVFTLTPNQINMFIDAAVKGDGYTKGNSRILYTSSGELAEDYNRLALLTGVNSTICKRELEGKKSWINDHWATSSCDGYAVSVTNKHTYIDCDKATPLRQHYEGKVYCATISGGVLYTRRNGYTMWSGNSAVPSKIWEVAEGGLTDGEPMFFCYGNPTRNDGKFHDTFNPNTRWTTFQIDSRKAKMTNKRLIQQWIDDYGEDSDFVRVRVKGQFPKAGDMQFLPSDVVEDAQTQPLLPYLGDEPLIMSFDVARGGGDDCRISFRRGKDAKSETSYRIPYENSRDSMRMLSKVVMVIERHKPNAIMVDSTGVGGPIHDRLCELGYNSYEVHFGSKADDEKRYYNKTAEMGDRLRKWLMGGGRIHNDEQLKRELTCREFWHDDKDKLVLERKKDIKLRLGYSPDWADSLYLLFALENVPRLHYKRADADVAPWAREAMMNKNRDYDPLDDM